MSEMTAIGLRDDEEFRREMTERIHRGVRWLNKHRPAWLQLDTDTLDLHSTDSCVLGKTGGWGRGMDLLEYEFVEAWLGAAECGFVLDVPQITALFPEHADDDLSYEAILLQKDAAYRLLTQMWTEVIEEFRS